MLASEPVLASTASLQCLASRSVPMGSHGRIEVSLRCLACVLLGCFVFRAVGLDLSSEFKHLTIMVIASVSEPCHTFTYVISSAV